MANYYPPNNNGQQPGYNQGYRSGYQQGYQQAYGQGYQQGAQQGYQQPYGNPYGPQNFNPAYGSPQFQMNDLFAESPEGKSRGLTALLCFFLGSIGVHYFYLGKVTAGIIYILLTVFTCGVVGPILALIQSIMLICMNNQDFRQKYILSTATFPF